MEPTRHDTDTGSPEPRPARADFGIREALPDEHQALGQLMVQVYSRLEGFPKPHEQPNYYRMLSGIGELALKPHAKLLVAVAGSRLLGGVVYFSDMAQYGSGGTATQEKHASGFRLLAVDPEARGLGVGRDLVKRCIALALEHKHAQVVIHTTSAMATAWKMYEKMGFKRSLDLDFMQGDLQVFGFRLDLTKP
jgi:GNAT superfamily N-acetyltransferase